MDSVERQGYGYEAIQAGTPDVGQNGSGFEGIRTDAVDTVANILHYLFGLSENDSLDKREADALSVWESACTHFQAEIRGQI